MRHRGLLLVLRGAPRAAAGVRRQPGLVARRRLGVRHRPGRSSARSPAGRRLSRGWRSSMCALALLSCSALLVVSWHGTTRGALPLLRDGRRARALRGVVGVPDGDRVRRAPARRDRRLRDAAPSSTTTTTPGCWAGIHGALRRRAGRRQPDLVARQRVRPHRHRDARRSASGARSTPRRWRWRSSRPTGALLQTNDELRERVGTGAEHFWDFVAGRRPRRAGGELAARVRRPGGRAALRARRRQPRLVPLAPLADPRRRGPRRTTTSPRASTSRPASTTPSASTTRPTTTRSPACPTARCSTARSPTRSSAAATPTRGSRSCSPTSTTSRSSTTRSATAPATSCWSPPPSG